MKTDVTKKKWTMYLSKHAKIRICERSSMKFRQISRILEDEQYIPIGLDNKGNKHNLIYSSQDDDFFILIHDEKDNALITMLPVDYHENIGWKIDYNLLDKLKKAILNKIPVRTVRTVRTIPITTDPTTLKISVVTNMDAEPRTLSSIKINNLKSNGYTSNLKDRETLETFLSENKYIRKVIWEKLKNQDIEIKEVWELMYSVGANGENRTFPKFQINTWLSITIHYNRCNSKINDISKK